MQRIGVDIIEIKRIEESIERFGQAFLERVYSDSEIDQYRDKLPSLAARFAAKEAVIKALNTTGLNPREIEVLSSKSGKPILSLFGSVKQKADELGIEFLEVSLSHSQDYAVAFVFGQ